MIRKIRGVLIVAVFGSFAWKLGAQELPPSPAPVTQTGLQASVVSTPGQQPQTLPAPAQQATPLLGSTLSGPPALLPPPPPGPPQLNPAYQDRNGPLLYGDPLLDHPQAPPPGWFAALELNAVGPHIKNRLQADVVVGGTTFPGVHLPSAEMDWAGAPRIELGYRFDQGWGEVLLSYRFMESEGTAILPGFDLDGSDGFLKSRLDLNVIDLDYASREFCLERWDMKWRAGVRLASIFFDSRGTGLFIEERTSNSFFGAGPHVGLDLWRSFKLPGLGFFTRIEGALPIGQVRQHFAASVVADDGSLVGGETRVRETQAVPTLNVQAGLGWSRWWTGHWSRYSIGYEWENWWQLGAAGGSRAELMSQGIFFRGEWGF